MINKVAQAIKIAHECYGNEYETIACAAIEALREPTIKMQQCGYDAWEGHHGAAVGEIYKAMIDEALRS
jgi:hypothetical protein